MIESVKLNLRTLSPVHIGSGAEISPSEYWYEPKSRQVHRLNLESLTRDPEFAEHLEKFVEGAAQARQIDQYVPLEILARHILYSLPAPGGAHYPIKALIKSGGQVMIPGSSLKGSLLSAVLWRLLRERGQQDQKMRDWIKTACQDTQGKSYHDLLGACLQKFCGDPVVDRPHENRFLQWLNVSDSNLLPAKGNLRVARIEVVGAKKSQIPMLMEVIREGVDLSFELTTPPGACRQQKTAWGVQEILETTDAFYRRVWQETEKNTPPPQGGWLLRLGQGSGAWATSLLLLAKDLGLNRNYVVQPPATQKKMEGIKSLGWVLLTTWTPNHQTKPAAVPPSEPDTSGPPPAVGPSPKLSQLLHRLQATKRTDAGQVGMFLDGLQAIASEEEKISLAQAIWDHFDRKMLKKHKRIAELENILAGQPSGQQF
jgi:CRISPR type III-A-associated RAMP protein Csm5